MSQTIRPVADRKYRALLASISNYCWAEHPRTHVHCTEPAGHPPRERDAGHYHPYSKISW